MYVTVIIPTFNDWNRLSICLEALTKQSYTAGLFEIIVVNNNPADTLPPNYQLPFNCTIITEPKPGSYAARNSALQIAKGEIIGFTDSDCIPDKNWLHNAVSFFQMHPGVERIAGHVELFYKKNKPNYTEIYDSVFSFQQAEYVEMYGMGVTANMFTYKSIFSDVGVFNEGLMSGGDFDWGKRAQAKQHLIAYAKDVIVKHPARNAYAQLKKKLKRVSGGHYNLSGTGKNMIKSLIISGLKPRLGTWKYINKHQEIGLTDKVIVFLMSYHLQIVSSYEKIKLTSGSAPERM